MPTPDDAPTVTQGGEAAKTAPLCQSISILAGAEAALPLPAEFSGDRYEIREELARGGMGLIHRATEATTGRDVAMKVMLRPRSENHLRRFLNEARITAQLAHPSIVPLYELGADAKGHAYYTMKLVEGVTLRDVLHGLRDGKAETVRTWTLSALLTVFQKVCDAVAFAHSRGVIHRDLKPANIMLGSFGEVLVMDWGLAKQFNDGQANAKDEDQVTGSPGPGDLTQDGAVIGSPVYMSPEQAAGKSDEVGPPSDVYALGAILYEMLALRPPVSGKDSSEVIEKVRSGRIDSLSTLPSSDGERAAATARARQRHSAHLPGGVVPSGLAAVAMKALALRSSDRYNDVPALQMEIAAYQAGFATNAEQASFIKQIGLAIRRHRREATVAGLLISLLAVVTVIAFVRINGERHHALAARAAAKRAGMERAILSGRLLIGIGNVFTFEQKDDGTTLARPIASAGDVQLIPWPKLNEPFVYERLRNAQSAPYGYSHVTHQQPRLTKRFDLAFESKLAQERRHPVRAWKNSEGTQNCAFCHESGLDGEFRNPISYERDCRNCHRTDIIIPPLRNIETNEEFRVDGRHTIAHGDPTKVMELSDPPALMVRLNYSAFESGLSDPQKRRRYVEAATAFLSKRGFQSQMDLRKALFYQGMAGFTACAQCHSQQISPARAEDYKDPRIVPTISILSPRVNLWLPPGVFEHYRHSNVSCISCHKVREQTSPESASVSLPPSEECRSCHLKQGLPLWPEVRIGESK